MAKCLFLDRDGIVNVDVGYASRPEQITFTPGIFPLCQKAQSLGYRIIIITNQSGIARGYYNSEQFQQLCLWINHQFAAHGVSISATYFCPHHPDISGPCRCRKPAAGMLLDAIADHAIDAGASIMIGDKLSDMQAAKQAGIGLRLLLDKNSPTATPATAIIHNLEQATHYLS